LFLAAAPLPAQTQPLVLDAHLDEWDALPVALDPGGAGPDAIDLDSLRAAFSGQLLAFSFTTGREIIPQSGNPLRLMIDLDGKVTTGARRGDLGVDLLWDFSERSGWLLLGDGRHSIGTEDIDLVVAPAMASTRFELSLRSPLQRGDSVGVLLHSIYEDGDQIGSPEGVVLPLTELQAPPSNEIAKQDSTDLRVMLWNCWDDNFRQQPEAFARIAQAISPDMLVLVDVEYSSADEIRGEVTRWLGLPDGGEWNVVHEGYDVAVASPYPILQSWPIPGMPRAGAFLLEMPSPFAETVFLLAIHPICCSNDRIRQEQVDAMLSFLRYARNLEGTIALEQDVPLWIIGDTNLVGWKSQYRGYTRGDIYDESTFGPDLSSSPGWFPLTDVVSRHTDGPQTYTWRDDSTPYGPARIDCVFYPEDRFSIGAHFVLDTRTMAEKRLRWFGLKREFSGLASDHLPHVVDFRTAP
jgi:hypothetical protein